MNITPKPLKYKRIKIKPISLSVIPKNIDEFSKLFAQNWTNIAPTTHIGAVFEVKCPRKVAIIYPYNS